MSNIEVKKEILTKEFRKLPEIEPRNIYNFDFSDLSLRPYFSGEHHYGKIEQGSELNPNEWLEILIPEWIINQRIDALSKKIEQLVLETPDKCPVGTVLEAGKPFMEKTLSRLSAAVLAKIEPGIYIDIKSRWGTEVQGKGYEINLLPPPEKVNGKTYLVFEMVADTCQTLQILQRSLTQPPYKNVDLHVFLLVDKTDSHPNSNLPNCVDDCLFFCGDFWVVGCGGDVDGRFRQLPYVAKYRKLPGH